MKKYLKKTWVQIIIFGVIVGVALIIVDEKTNWFNKDKSESKIYNGPISIEKDKTYFTEVSFSEKNHDFGKVKEGDTLSYVFKMTNIGKEPLFVYKTSQSCDCLAAVVTKEMIQPGTEVEIKTYFDTKGRKGIQNRTITLTCNTDPAEIALSLKADVE